MKKVEKKVKGYITGVEVHFDNPRVTYTIETESSMPINLTTIDLVYIKDEPETIIDFMNKTNISEKTIVEFLNKKYN